MYLRYYPTLQLSVSFCQSSNLVEEAVHVDVDGVAVAGVVHDVLGVPVAQADDVADLNRISGPSESEM